MLLPIKPISQRDARWKYKKLGTSTKTIGGYGCVISCVAMQAGWYGHKVRPDEINELIKKKKGYVNKNLLNWEVIPKIYSDITWKGSFSYQTRPADIKEIKRRIDAKQPTILKVEADEIGTPKGSHFILCLGYTDKDIIVNDPWTGKQFILGQHYSHNGSRKPEHIILGTRKFRGNPRPMTDKKIHYYEEQDENENPDIIRKHRDRNWQWYQKHKKLAEELESTLDKEREAYEQAKQDFVRNLSIETNKTKACAKNHNKYVQTVAEMVDASAVNGEGIEAASIAEIKGLTDAEDNLFKERGYHQVTKDKLQSEAVRKREIYDFVTNLVGYSVKTFPGFKRSLSALASRPKGGDDYAQKEKRIFKIIEGSVEVCKGIFSSFSSTVKSWFSKRRKGK